MFLNRTATVAIVLVRVPCGYTPDFVGAFIAFF
jgi:hypothetical protein